ncbi:TPA: hypothetical protein I7730_16060 [Vibrio vulnificus]|uniref:Uncharacterized protein n=1 Tax=Vibrio vulnificus TaxID=672 RepID=A0A8H9TGC7_VIBVL|nr:hypothetical protein [Vibrio vulnificus]HAS8541298.1 hypothetical protein [Vibrio vulnificus]
MQSLKQEIQGQIFTEYTQEEINQSKGHVFTIETGDKETPFVAVVPSPMVDEFNYAFKNKAETWAWLVTARELHPQGKNWELDPAKKDECANELYSLLSGVPVNGDDEIEEDFLHFDKGTDRECIWHWFESELDTSIAKLEGIV